MPRSISGDDLGYQVPAVYHEAAFHNGVFNATPTSALFHATAGGQSHRPTFVFLERVVTFRKFDAAAGCSAQESEQVTPRGGSGEGRSGERGRRRAGGTNGQIQVARGVENERERKAHTVTRAHAHAREREREEVYSQTTMKPATLVPFAQTVIIMVTL